jgi:hypothetical protein
VLNWLADHSGLFRRLTDRKVHCELCGAFVGYVWLRGHRVWHCAACSPFHEPTPVE